MAVRSDHSGHQFLFCRVLRLPARHPVIPATRRRMTDPEAHVAQAWGFSRSGEGELFPIVRGAPKGALRPLRTRNLFGVAVLLFHARGREIGDAQDQSLT